MSLMIIVIIIIVINMIAVNYANGVVKHLPNKVQESFKALTTKSDIICIAVALICFIGYIFLIIFPQYSNSILSVIFSPVIIYGAFILSLVYKIILALQLKKEHGKS